MDLIKNLLDELSLQADTHSSGETLSAHRASDCNSLKNSFAGIKEDYGVESLFYSQSELRQLGMQGQFHGALTIPVGFALNPRKYAYGLLNSTVKNGGKVFENSPVIDLKKVGGTFRLTTPQGWSSAQIAYDTHQFLHYFRLMPNQQFLFGMRGNLFSTNRSEAAIQS